MMLNAERGETFVLMQEAERVSNCCFNDEIDDGGDHAHDHEDHVDEDGDHDHDDHGGGEVNIESGRDE